MSPCERWGGRVCVRERKREREREGEDEGGERRRRKTGEKDECRGDVHKLGGCSTCVACTGTFVCCGGQ